MIWALLIQAANVDAAVEPPASPITTQVSSGCPYSIEISGAHAIITRAKAVLNPSCSQ